MAFITQFSDIPTQCIKYKQLPDQWLKAMLLAVLLTECQFTGFYSLNATNNPCDSA